VASSACGRSDADFKLHLNGGGTLSGAVKDGKLLTWDIAPACRRRDVVVGTPALAAFSPFIPENKQPLHIGCDSNGQNQFKGAIGRVTLFRGTLSAPEVRAMAQNDRSKPIPGAKVVASAVTPKAGDILPTQAADWCQAPSLSRRGSTPQRRRAAASSTN